MKITNELRRIIMRHVKEDACKKAEAENERRRKLAHDIDKMIHASDEYKAFVAAAEALNQKTEDITKSEEGIFVEPVVSRQLLKHAVFVHTIQLYSSDICDDMCDRIILELSCGKDLDAAREILKKYGIEL